MRPHIHKLGGASLADAAAVRHAVNLLKRQTAPLVVVVSAMAGVTDALLHGATRAASGDEDALVATAADLEARHLAVCDAVVPSLKARAALSAAITRSFGELQSFAHGLAILKELTAKTSDYIVARGERMSARVMAAALQAAGTKSEYIDAAMCRTIFETSEITASRDLAELLRLQFIDRVGKGRATKYRRKSLDGHQLTT